jgi:hypothetical protein
MGIPNLPGYSGTPLPGSSQGPDPASFGINDNWGYPGGGSEGGSNSFADILKNLRLLPTSDCQNTSGRSIYYNLVNIMHPDSEGPGGYANPIGKYTVREHVTDRNGKFVRTSADYFNSFADAQSALFPGQVTDHLQNFTITPGDTTSLGSPNGRVDVPGGFGVPVRWGGQDYNALGLWKSGSLNFINGQQARPCGAQ